MRQITPKEEKFCHVYVETSNASEAYRSAYNTNTKRAQTIHDSASKILSRPEVKQRVDELRAQLSEKSLVSPEMVLREYKKIADFDSRNFFHPDGKPKKIHELDDATAACILSVGFLDNEGTIDVSKTRVIDKTKALHSLSKHLGLYEKDNAQKTNISMTIEKILEEVDGSSSGLPGADK